MFSTDWTAGGQFAAALSRSVTAEQTTPPLTSSSSAPWSSSSTLPSSCSPCWPTCPGRSPARARRGRSTSPTSTSKGEKSDHPSPDNNLKSHAPMPCSKLTRICHIGSFSFKKCKILLHCFWPMKNALVSVSSAVSTWSTSRRCWGTGCRGPTSTSCMLTTASRSRRSPCSMSRASHPVCFSVIIYFK